MATPLFPRWSNDLLRWSMVGVCLAVLMVVVLMFSLARSPLITNQYHVIEQPVQFDHRHHVVDEGIDCRYCHRDVEHGAYAGMPAASVCMNCHSQVWNRAGILGAVRDSYYQEMPIHWRRVNALPAFVFFNHAAHVTRGVGCTSCHGPIGTMASVYQDRPLTMAWCIECHRNPQGILRTQDQITSLAWSPTDLDQAQQGAKLAGVMRIAPPLNCSGCHR